MIRNLFIVTAVAAVTCLAAAPVSAQIGDGNSPNYLFSQYATPDGPNMTTAGMYPAPHYSPALGAQSYYTYQPLMPHEMMYQHSRNYFNYYSSNNCGATDSVNKTSVRWMSGANHIGQLKRTHGISDFGYRIHSRKYGLSGCEGGDCEGSSRKTRQGHGHRLRKGGLGCNDGGCDSCGSACSGDVLDSGYGGNCATGCTANLSDGSLRR